MLRYRRLFAVSFVIGALTLAARAHAQAGDASRAEMLFNEGRDARDHGDFAGACAKFSESLALVKRPSTLVNLAGCEAKLGKLKVAFDHAREAVSLLPPGDGRLPIAKKTLDDIGQRVPHVTVKLGADVGSDAQVSVDGAALDTKALTTPIILDPGEHVFVVSASGHADATTRVTLAEAQRAEVALTLGRPTGERAASSVAPDGSQAGRAGATRRTLGFALGGVGLAGLAVAAVTGGVLLANDATIKSECPDGSCTDRGMAAIDTSKTLIAINYVAWGVGIVGLGAGIVLIVTSPRSQPARATVMGPWVSAGASGVALRQAF